MLGNNKHFYPGQDDKDGENEEEEEEREGEDDGKGEREENGGLDGVEDMTGGRQSWEGKGGDGMKPAAVVVGRQRADRAPKLQGNSASRGLPYVSVQNHIANKQQHHFSATNQQPHHPGVNALHKRRALRERSMTTVALQEDAFLTMMVFRIGIPDIKQTVGARCSERDPQHEAEVYIVHIVGSLVHYLDVKVVLIHTWFSHCRKRNIIAKGTLLTQSSSVQDLSVSRGKTASCKQMKSFTEWLLQFFY